MTENDISKIVKTVMGSVNGGKKMTLALAKTIIEKIEKKASEIGVNAVIAISDASANPVAVVCMDDSLIASFDIAVNKAYTVSALKMSTEKLKKLSQPGAELYGIQFTNGGKIVIFGGGEVLAYNGNIIGGLGVSGGSEEQDSYLARYGLEVFIKEMSK